MRRGVRKLNKLKKDIKKNKIKIYNKQISIGW